MKIIIHSIFLLFIIANIIYLVNINLDNKLKLKNNKVYSLIHTFARDSRFKVDSIARRA